jgi:hypothetical protein
MRSRRHQISQVGQTFTVEKIKAGPALLCLALTLVFAACLAPGVADAAFVRPFLRQISNTCEKPGEPLSCPGSKAVPLDARGVAVDANNDLWVGDGEGHGASLAEFEPAY